MSAWNNFTSDERMHRWKDLRTQLDSLTDEEQLTEIANFFATIPISSRKIDFYTPEAWPTPWESLYNNELCQSSIGLLMYYTLQMCNYKGKVEIILIDDEQDRYLVPMIDDHYILNYELGQISIWQQLKSYIKLINTFNNTNIKQFT